jgi:hypothetical protein
MQNPHAHGGRNCDRRSVLYQPRIRCTREILGRGLGAAYILKILVLLCYFSRLMGVLNNDNIRTTQGSRRQNCSRRCLVTLLSHTSITTVHAEGWPCKATDVKNYEEVVFAIIWKSIRALSCSLIWFWRQRELEWASL